MTMEASSSERKAMRLIRWVRLALVGSILLLVVWSACWYLYLIRPQVGMDAEDRSMRPDSGKLAQALSARSLVFPWGLLTPAVTRWPH